MIDKLSISSYNNVCYAVVAELADALDSGSSARKGMEVQVLSTAPVIPWLCSLLDIIAK